MVVLNNIVMYHGIIRWTFIERDMNNSYVISTSQGGVRGRTRL